MGCMGCMSRRSWDHLGCTNTTCELLTSLNPFRWMVRLSYNLFELKNCELKNFVRFVLINILSHVVHYKVWILYLYCLLTWMKWYIPYLLCLLCTYFSQAWEFYNLTEDWRLGVIWVYIYGFRDLRYIEISMTQYMLVWVRQTGSLLQGTRVSLTEAYLTRLRYIYSVFRYWDIHLMFLVQCHSE